MTNARNLANRSTDFVSVRDFGARGDGVTDDTAAIQAALNSGAAYVLVPEGNYRLTDALQVPSEVTVIGQGYASKLTQTGTDKRVLYATSADYIVIRGLFVEGNNTGNGSTSAGATGGDGVFFYGCDYVEVSDCFFDKIGQSTYAGFANCVGLYDCTKIRVKDNNFLANSKSRTGADIGFGYYCSEALIAGNVSVSEHDSFISGSSVGLVDADTVHHIISGNFGARSDSSDARTGILVPYNAKPAYANVSNNVIVNFPANGIYLSAGADGAATDSAGVTVANNVIRFCGGDSNMTGISAGIYLSGRAGAICSGNLVVKSGYKSDGTTRDDVVSGILIVGSSRNISVASNVSNLSRGYGLTLRNTSSGITMESLTVSGNTFYDNAGGGIEISVANATAVFKDVLISSNIMRQENNDADAVTITQSTSAVIAGVFDFVANKMQGISGSTKYGINSNVAGMVNWSVRSNNIKNFATGIRFSNATIADKEIGYNCVVESNTFDTCTTGVSVNFSTGKYAFLYSNAFINCTSQVSDANRVLNAVRLNGNMVEVQRSTTPSDGAWILGQRVIDVTPASGAPMGWVCSASGSPGTWLAMANLT